MKLVHRAAMVSSRPLATSVVASEAVEGYSPMIILVVFALFLFIASMTGIASFVYALLCDGLGGMFLGQPDSTRS